MNEDKKEKTHRYKVMCTSHKLVLIYKVKPNPKNPNKHSDEQINLLAKVIEKTGFRNPIVVSKRSGYIVKGHARFLAAKKLEGKYVPVDYQEYESEVEEYQDMVADNKLSDLSEVDEQLVFDTIKEMEFGFTKEFLDLVDFKSDEIDSFTLDPLKDSKEEHAEKTEEIPDKKEVKSISKEGDLFGFCKNEDGSFKHYLYCGNSTNLDNVQSIIDQLNISLNHLLTDPPWDIYKNTLHKNKNYKSKAFGWTDIDALSKWDEGFSLSAEMLDAFYSIMQEDSSLFVFPGQPALPEILLYIRELNKKRESIESMVVWDKPFYSLRSRNFYRKHELVIGSFLAKKFVSMKGVSHEDVIYSNNNKGGRAPHPTSKPIYLIKQLLLPFKDSIDYAFDPFAGSGSLMVACHELNIKSFNIEVSTEYTDLIISRYKRLYKEDGVLINNFKNNEEKLND